MAFVRVLSLVGASLLLFGGVRPEAVPHFSRAGDSTTLPCDGLQHHGPTCSDVDWWFYKDRSSRAITKVSNGQVQDRSSRLTLNPNCSLSLQDVTEEDAGVFQCKLHDLPSVIYVHLNVLTRVRPEAVPHFSRAGDSTTLPCDGLQHHGPTCSDVDWWFYKDRSSRAITKVSNGQVQDRSSRLTLNPDCSLSLQDVTEEDAGVFQCKLHDRPSVIYVHLNVLTVSSAAADGAIWLRCSLTPHDAQFCDKGSFRWRDQNSEDLPGETKSCVSYLTVGRRSQDNRLFACQFVERGVVKVSAQFAVFAENGLRGNKTECVFPTTPGVCCPGSSWFLLLKAVGWGALIIVTVVVSIYTREKKTKETSGDYVEMASIPNARPGNTAPSADYENQQ